MGKEVITLGENSIENHKFQRYRNQFFKKDVNFHNILLSNKLSPGD